MVPAPAPGAPGHGPGPRPRSFPPERIDGGPLTLRRVRPDDAVDIARAVAASMDHLRPWMPWATAEAATPRAQLSRVAEADEAWESGTDFIYSVLPAGESAVAGQVGLHRRAGDGGAEIGYWIAASHVRRGLATAAARAMTPVALALPGVSRVEIHCDEANTASAAIPRTLGYRLDRIETIEPEAPGERGQRMIWVTDTARPWAARVRIGTSAGPALAELELPPGRPGFLLVLTHGAGGAPDQADLLAVREAALRLGGAVALVTQPYRVSGRRSPGPAARQDAAWLEAVAGVREAVARETGGQLPLIQGGRSNGARVACRTARAAGAAAVVALAFPVHPPGRPGRSRAGELLAAGTDVLVVNGDRDPFGVPEPSAGIRVAVLAGETHALSRDPEAVGRTVGAWLRGDVLGRPAEAGAPGR
jgi:predicted alpha/beta-hydrolase family hydrolase/RimJ/RimL family protein N-acetyltransferase